MENKRKIGIYALQCLLSLLFIVVIYRLGFIPLKYIYWVIAFIVFLLGIGYYLIFYKKENSKRSLIMQICSIILSIVLAIGSFYVYKVGQAVDIMTLDSFHQKAISIVVLDDSKILNENQIEGSNFAYVSTIDKETMDFAIGEIKKEFSIHLTTCNDFEELMKLLYDKEVDGIILDEAFRTSVSEMKKTFTDDTRVVYQVVKEMNSVNAKNVEVTENPFFVYISGIDEYGELTSVSRSDVNMLVGVNPKTHQVFLISIPRDTYYPLDKNDQYDKFTHAGIYGVEESINTLQNIVDTDINYYARMNFTSFIDIVDVLGGVSVYSAHDFTTVKGKYEIKEGMNDLDSKQALSFVRERKSFIDGDFERGRNQQRMIVAIMDKMLSPAMLTSFTSVLDTISKSVETNMSSNEINALLEMQIANMVNWDIQTYQITGESTKESCYSLGGQYASVIVPDEASILEVQELIDQFLEGEVLDLEGSIGEQ